MKVIKNIKLPDGNIYKIGGGLDDKITNCITEIPQDIKLELNNGVLTLKAGSKVYVPNGFEADGVTKKFDEVTVENDITYSEAYMVSVACYVVYNQTIKNINILALEDTGFSYDSTNNKVIHSNLSGNTLSLPISLVHRDTTGIGSLDQTFNGFGYIGSTVFVTKGVKGLIPNGRNEDGTLRNNEVAFDGVKTATLTYGNQDYYIGLDKYKNIHFLATHITTYLEDENFTLDHVTGIHQPWALVGRMKGDANNAISNFTPKLPFRAVDYNDKSEVSGWAMPSSKYINLTLNASGSYYTAPANGYIVFCKASKNVGESVTITRDLFQSFASSSKTGAYITTWCPVAKGQSFKVDYSLSGDTIYFRFIYAEGEV